MKKIIPFLAVLLFASTAHADRLHHEAVYQESWCAQNSGVTEYILPDKARVDCLTDDYAIEFDFADKWAEAIGQARYYANVTGREPGIVFIMEDAERDYKYLIRLLKSIEDDPKHWRIWIMEPGNSIQEFFQDKGEVRAFFD